MSDKPTRCISPCLKLCQDCQFGYVIYPDWVETYLDTLGCTFESGCLFGLENTIPTEEEEKEFEKWINCIKDE